MDHSKATILVVDDNERNLMAMKATLDSLGHELVCVSSGYDALRELLVRDVALVILDVQMPGMNGLEVAQAMKTRDRSRHVPIIFVTALSRETAWVMKGYETGAVDYLLKPLDPTMLCAKVQVFVELWRRGKQLEENARQLERSRMAELEAQRAAELEQELMAIVAHDIRSPLTTIGGTADILRSRLGADAVAVRGVERIKRSGRRLEELSSLLLDYTRARTGRHIPVRLETVNVAQLCREIADEVRDASGTEVAIDPPHGDVLANVDAKRLRQLIFNLVENAVKHGSSDQPITIRLRCAATGELELSVHNFGRAIPEENRPRLFEPFSSSSEKTAASSPSVGLGLYIVKVIAQAHGGTVTVTSSDDTGTQFEVTIPGAACSAETAATTA